MIMDANLMILTLNAAISAYFFVGSNDTIAAIRTAWVYPAME